MAESEVTHAMRHLFAGPEGRAQIDKLDRDVARLPGLAGLTVFADALAQRGITA